MDDSQRDLLNIQASVLFVHDERQRLLRINESEAEDPAPRFFLSRGLTDHIWRIRHDVSDDLAQALDRLAADEVPLADWSDDPRHLDAYINVLREQEPISQIESGPSYSIPARSLSAPGVAVTAQNESLLHHNFPYTASHLNEREPVLVRVEAGTAVAACYSARSSALASEAGVDTLEPYRGRGFAVELTQAWANAVWQAGRIPLYSTSWSNQASQAVARKLGAVQYGVWFHIT